MGVAVDALVLQRVRGVEHPLDRLEPVLLLALGDIVAGKVEIVEDAARRRSTAGTGSCS